MAGLDSPHSRFGARSCVLAGDHRDEKEALAFSFLPAAGLIGMVPEHLLLFARGARIYLQMVLL